MEGNSLLPGNSGLFLRKDMFSEEVRSLLVEVITSWQVIAVTIVLLLFIALVNYAARTHRKSSRRFSMPAMPSMKKNEKAADDVVSDDGDDAAEFEEE